jgi:predicted phage baseplate assembly protein
MSDTNEFLNTCNCCPDEPEQPEHTNPPGLPSLDYRLGVHGEFLARMIADLTRAKIPDGEHAGQKPLLNLTTREPDDPAIALLDAWAVAADILTFYQERIANEGYLRTATERRSILELARAIGYELRPGVAAGTYLSFQIEAAKGAPKSALIPKGTAVQSIPAKQGESPQTFETSVDFTGYPEWNKLKPQLTEIQNISDIETVSKLHLKGIDNNLRQGDMLLLIDSSSGTIKTAVRAITEAEVLFSQDTTVVTLEGGSSSAGGGGGASTTGGGGSASWLGLPEAIEFTGTTVYDQIYQLALSEAALQAVLGMYTWSAYDVLSYQYTPAPPPAGISVHVFRETAAAFGHNAPRWETLPDPTETRGGTADDPYSNGWDGSDARHIWQDSQGSSNAPADVYLERAIKGINQDTYVAFVSPSATTRPVYQVAKALETSRVDYALSGKATALSVTDVGASSLTKDTTLMTRETTAYLKSEELTLAELPITSPIAKESTSITLDSMVVGLAKDQAVALTGEQADATGVTRSEVHVLKAVTHANKRTTLEFATKLAYSYKRDTLILNANTVPATHGETVAKEVLGSGNGSARNQRFKLKKPPLTHTSASTAGGTESSLEVRIDGVLWEETSSLYPLKPEDHKYVVRRDNEGNSTVIFGDGVHGARLPTGQENVGASYRSGIGTQGEVEAGSLTMLKAKPLGVKEVNNLVKASGAGNPEVLDTARENAPLTVKTLDRIVSLQDFTDFARAFAGIGKAQALPLWSGEQQIVHITVATESGGAVTDPLLGNLRDAIDEARDPSQRLELGSFQRRYFHLKASLLIDEAYRWQDVEAAVQKAIKTAFAFNKRGFSQPVTAAEVIDLIHDQRGVVAVDLDELYVVDEDGNPVGEVLSTVLTAETARWNASETAILPAELLIVNPGGIKLSEMKDK